MGVKRLVTIYVGISICFMSLILFLVEPLWLTGSAVVLILVLGCIILLLYKAFMKQIDFLHENSSILDSFFDASSGILNLFDDQGRYIKADRVTSEFFGLDRKAILGKSAADINPEFFQKFLGPKIKSILSGQQPEANMEVAIPAIKDNGMTFWRVSYFPVSLGKGRIGIGCIGVDITELKIAERALAESEEKFRTYAESIPQIAFISSNDDKITYLNHRFTEFFQCDGNSCVGTRYLDLNIFHPDDFLSTAESWTRSIRDGDVFQIEHRLKHSNGEYKWYLARALPLKNKSGVVLSWVGTETDINEQKLSQQMLKDTIHQREEFLSIAGHELKTPITSLKLHVELSKRMREKGDASIYSTEKIDALIDQFDLQVGKLTKLTKDILDIAAVKTGKLRMEKEIVDLVLIIKRTLNSLDVNFSAAGVKIKFSCNSSVIMAMVDPSRIEQLLTNLVLNSLKYGQGKPVNLHMQHSEEEKIVSISVIDQGIGIDIKDQDRIFECFERAVDKSEVSGFGLGLYIAKQITLGHSGHIYVRSEGVGKGATFTVHLPLNC